MNLIFKQ